MLLYSHKSNKLKYDSYKLKYFIKLIRNDEP